MIFFVFQTELSQTLQALSEKAKAETEFIQKLKAMTERIPVSFIILIYCQVWNLVIFEGLLCGQGIRLWDVILGAQGLNQLIKVLVKFSMEVRYDQ